MNFQNLPESAKLAISAVVLIVLLVLLFKGISWIASFISWLQKKYLNARLEFKQGYRWILFGSMLIGFGGLILSAIVQLIVNGIHSLHWLTTESKTQFELSLSKVMYPVWVFFILGFVMLLFVSSLKRQRSEFVRKLLDEGDIATALRELDQIHREPGMTVSVDAELDSLYAYALVLAGQVPRALTYLRDSERRMRGSTKFQSWISTAPEHLLRYNAEAVEVERLRIGRVLCELGHFEEALELTEESVSQLSTEIIRLGLKGAALIGLGRLREAEMIFSSALREAAPLFYDSDTDRELIAIRMNMGLCLLLQHKYMAAIRILQEAKTKLSQQVARGYPELIECQCLLARAYADSGNITAAAGIFDTALYDELQFLSMAATGMRENNLLHLMDRMQVHLDQYLAYLIENHELDPTLIQYGMIHSLRRKGLALQAVALLKQMKSKTSPVSQRLEKVRQELTDILFSAGSTSVVNFQKRIEALDVQRIALEEEFYHDDEARRIRLNPGEITLSTIQAKLPPDAVVVQFVAVHRVSPDGSRELGNAHYIAFVLQPSARTPKFCDIGSADEIESLVIQLHREIEAYQENSYSQTQRWKTLCQRLYDRLVSGWMQIGRKYTRWILLTDEILNFVPFPILMDRQGKCLVERYQMTVAGSIRDLVPQSKSARRQTRASALLVGDPSFDLLRMGSGMRTTRGLGMNPFVAESFAKRRTLFPLLPGTRQEVLDIQELLLQAGSATPTVLMGPDARKDQVIHVAMPTILHLATHAFFLPADRAGSGNKMYSSIISSVGGGFGFRGLARSPYLQSGLVFAGANERSQMGSALLTAEEVLSMNLHETDMVVLSACQTALGTVMRGEGVMGLHRAFTIAGARNVIASLWKVSDEKTVTLMRYFYSEYMRTNNKSLALQKAMLELIHDLKRDGKDCHPALWGAFFCFGPPDYL